MCQNHMNDDGDSEGVSDPLTTFNEYRSLLFSIAYRMLGTVADEVTVLEAGRRIASGTLAHVASDDAVKMAYLGRQKLS